MKIGVKVYLWTPQSDKSISSQFLEKAPPVRPTRLDQLVQVAEILYSETLTGFPKPRGRLFGRHTRQTFFPAVGVRPKDSGKGC